MILCNSEMQIIQPLEWQKWSDRAIKAKVEYVLPRARVNPLNLDDREMDEVIRNSRKDKLGTFLAIELGLGGKYSKFICKKEGFTKDIEPDKFDDTKKLVEGLKRIFDTDFRAEIIDDDVYPCFKKDCYESFSMAYDSLIEVEEAEEEKFFYELNDQNTSEEQKSRLKIRREKETEKFWEKHAEKINK